MSEISQKGKKKKKHIILQAATLMREEKFETITVRRICEAAEISIGTFYHYFEKKENVAIGIFELIDDYIEYKLMPSLNSDDEIENIIGYCRGFANYAEKLGVSYSQAINSLFPAPSIYSRDTEKRRPLYYELRSLIQRGMDKGQIGKVHSADQITDAIILVLRGTDFDWARRGGDYSLTARIAEMMRVLVSLLRPLPA